MLSCDCSAFRVPGSELKSIWSPSPGEGVISEGLLIKVEVEVEVEAKAKVKAEIGSFKV